MLYSSVFSHVLHPRSDYPVLEHQSYQDGVLLLSKLSGVMAFGGHTIMPYGCLVTIVSTRHDLPLCGVRRINLQMWKLAENMLNKDLRLADKGQYCS